MAVRPWLDAARTIRTFSRVLSDIVWYSGIRLIGLGLGAELYKALSALVADILKGRT